MEILLSQVEPEELSIIKVEERGLISVEKEISKQIWVGDSGASCYKTNSEERLHNWRPVKKRVRMGIGSILEATKCGSLTASCEDPDTGREAFFDLKEVPGFLRNLFSYKAALKEEATLKSKGESMIVVKGRINRERGFECCIQNQE
jgi:hypothetical protein